MCRGGQLPRSDALLPPTYRVAPGSSQGPSPNASGCEAGQPENFSRARLMQEAFCCDPFATFNALNAEPQRLRASCTKIDAAVTPDLIRGPWCDASAKRYQ